ncbi:hypothetical protein, partial [Brevundimonas naejangsanensis]|uniref:hypothetical protein n=1 Tax=Brevundimonas naejangsanensis TaxID=588932 RepID=UPI001B7FE0B5
MPSAHHRLCRLNRSDGTPIDTRIGPVTIEDVTAREAARAAAAASVISAATAEAFSGEAGDHAAAAEGAAVQAETNAGDSQAFRNQAVDARDGAVAARNATGTLAQAAQDARDDARSARDDAAAAAAQAQLTANLAAQIGGGSMNQNPTFSAWSGSASVGPDNWFAVNAGNGVLSKGPGANGQPQSLRTASTSTANYSVNSSTFAGAVGGEWLALTVEFTLVSGDLRGSGVQIHKRQDGSQIGGSLNLNFATEADAAGNVAGSGVAGRRYTFTKLLDGRQAGVNGYSVFARTRLSTFNPVGAVTIDWHRVSVEVATAEQVETNTVLPAVQAQLAIVADVAASA